jgi:hypothetical protein
MKNTKLHKMTYSQKSTWPNLTGKTPKEGSIRDIHQKKKARNKATEKSRWQSSNEELANEATEANTAYDKAVQTRADQKDWSDRKRARVERKKGVELGDKSVYYTKGALESEGFKVSDDGKTVSNPDNLDFELPTGTQTTNIDRDRFRNTYTISGEYKGTRKRPFGGIKDSPDPNPNDPNAQYTSSNTYSSATNWDQYSGKTKRAWIKKYKQGKTSANLNKGEINEAVKEDAENIKLRDTLTKKGRAKLRTFYLKHEAIPGEVKSLKNRTDIYHDDDASTANAAKRTTIQEKQSIYAGIKKKK